MNLYAYCLGPEMDGSVLEGLRGLGGASPFIAPYEGIVAVVSEFGDGPITVTRENVLAHENVISHVFAQTTPLPFRFGALLRPEELGAYIKLNRESLIAMLERVQGTVEMSVKIIHQPESDGDGGRGRGEAAEAGAASGQEMGRGAMFLASKQRELADRKMIDEQARETANWLAEQLASVVNDSFVRLRPTAGLALKAAHLVERSRLDEYRERLRRAREKRPELLFLTSGPWPPYSFCDLTTRSKDSMTEASSKLGWGGSD